MKSPTVEASLIVKNEEQMLEGCLESIIGIDLITIVDTGSTDKTVEIARKYTDKVYTDYKWEDNFAKARNVSKNRCTGDWILVIDADETLETPISEVKKVVERADKAGAHLINCEVIAKDGTSRSRNQRLFKNIPEVKWYAAAHNYLGDSSKPLPPKFESNIVIEYGYSPAHKKDPNRTLRILRKAVKETPKLVRERYYLAREYFYKKKYKLCVDQVDKYLKVAHWAAEIAEAYMLKAYSLWNIGGRENAELARTSCVLAIKCNPDNAEPFELLAEMYYPPLKEVWISHAAICKNRGVLFEKKSKYNKIVYYSRGIEHFGKKLIEELGFRKYNPQTDYEKRVLFDGIYYQEDIDAIKNHKGEKVIYWNGSDTLLVIRNNAWLNEIAKANATNWCQSEWQVEVLRRMGINAVFYPVFFGNLGKYKISYKPSKTVNMYMNCHPGREKEYGLDVVRKLAEQVKDVKFHVYGIDDKSTKNLIFHGWVDENIMDEEISHFQGAIQGPVDGVSHTIIKSIMMGQYPTAMGKVYELPYSPDIPALKKHIEYMKQQKKPNEELRNKMLNYYKPIVL